MKNPAVLKIGGSLSRGMGLPALCREIGTLGTRHSLLVIPGGGSFAEEVRKADRRFHLDQTAAHCMALLAMDQYAYILNQLIAGSCLMADLDVACRWAQPGRVVVLLPSAPVLAADPLPHSWQVTSDTIAAWICNKVGSRRLVLLKDVDGLLSSGGLIQGLTAEELANHTGGVDEFLSNILSLAQFETWIISGLHPERLSELLDKGCTKGTRVTSQ